MSLLGYRQLAGCIAVMAGVLTRECAQPERMEAGVAFVIRAHPDTRHFAAANVNEVPKLLVVALSRR